MGQITTITCAVQTKCCGNAAMTLRYADCLDDTVIIDVWDWWGSSSLLRVCQPSCISRVRCPICQARLTLVNAARTTGLFGLQARTEGFVRAAGFQRCRQAGLFTHEPVRTIPTACRTHPQGVNFISSRRPDIWRRCAPAGEAEHARYSAEILMKSAVRTHIDRRFSTVEKLVLFCASCISTPASFACSNS